MTYMFKEPHRLKNMFGNLLGCLVFFSKYKNYYIVTHSKPTITHILNTHCIGIYYKKNLLCRFNPRPYNYTIFTFLIRKQITFYEAELGSYSGDIRFIKNLCSLTRPRLYPYIQTFLDSSNIKKRPPCMTTIFQSLKTSKCYKISPGKLDG